MAPLDQIDTIVIVMMENRSFDHVLGYLQLPRFGGRTDIDGLLNADSDPKFANEYDHQIYRPFPISDGPLLHDLPHGRAEVRTELAFTGNIATMSGFVQAYVDATHSVVNQPPPMGYCAADSVPMTNFLARNYLVCDHWFAPLPADTQPNRAMAYTGSSLIDDTKGRLIPYRNLVFDWLTQHNVHWRVYHSGLSFFLLFGLVDEPLGDNFRSILRFAGDLHDATDNVPEVIFVEPEYNDSPVHFGFQPNDNHPPLPIGPGEEFLRQIYTAVTKSPRWPRTMLIVTYDEHGGFFDHVPPLPVKMPVPSGATYQEAFATTGVRVPAIIISPFVQSGTSYNGPLDHTSILQLLAEKFTADPKKYSDDVTRRRDQGIGSLSAVLQQSARQDVPVAPSTSITVPQVLLTTQPFLNENQKAFKVAGEQLLAHDRVQALVKFPQLVHLQLASDSGNEPKNVISGAATAKQKKPQRKKRKPS